MKFELVAFCLLHAIHVCVSVCVWCAGVGASGYITGDHLSFSSWHSPHSPCAGADIMFLDIFMPGKSGIEVVRDIVGPHPFPIVAMTGNVDNASVANYKCVRLWGMFSG